jgi:peptidoglycan/xylan/chitin deacetylase (PgdA/CDA1 family)
MDLRRRITRSMATALPLALLTAGAVTAGEPAGGTVVRFPWPNGARAAVALTYDDAIDTHLDHAAPDLDAAGLHGTFFVSGSSRSLAERLPEWRDLAKRGHELGNHALFHPCLKNPPGGGDRAWVRDEYALEGYTIPRIADEVRVMNTLLLALDGQSQRTFAYGCTETVAGGQSYVDALRPLVLAARIGGARVVEDVRGLDPLLVPSWAVESVSGAEMIAFAQKAVDSGGLAVFMFHGVGGDYISVSREAHRELLAWLAAHRDVVWTDTFRAVMTHVVAEQSKPAP